MYKQAPNQTKFLAVYVYEVVLFLASCTLMYKQALKEKLSLFVYVHGMVLSIATCTSMYKQAPKQTYLQLFMFTGWCFYSHLVLWGTNGHQNKPIFSCLSLWDGAVTRI